MARFRRLAVYVTPPPGPLADFAAAWLGWDSAAGREVPHPPLPGLDPEAIATLTATPRRYGFHATIKPPFALAPGSSAEALTADLRALCAARPPVVLAQGLALRRVGGFLALVPAVPSPELSALATAAVERLDAHRAPLTAADRARRNPDALTPRQRALLDRWGYPWVFEEFTFHMTLTGPLDATTAAQVQAALGPALAPLLPRPFVIDALTLSGEDDAGRFHDLARVPLTDQQLPGQ